MIEVRTPIHGTHPGVPNRSRQPQTGLRTLLPAGACMLLALLPLLLILRTGYPAEFYDFNFHVTSWFELHQAWAAHEWRLGWAQWAQYGFGEPRFCFYPPLSFLVGAGLSFLMPFRAVPAVVIWLVLVLSAWSMYKAGESILAPEHRLSAAILYMLNPYLLCTLVRRFAYAEAWVEALLPLTFLYFFQAVSERRPRAAGLAALLLAAGWLTDIPEAIVIFYGFCFLAVVLAVYRKSIRPVVMAALIQGVAIGLAAFRLLPAMQEKGWISTQAFVRDLPFYMIFGKIDPTLEFQMLFDTAYVLLALAILVPVVWQRVKREGGWRAPVISFAFLTAFAIFLNLTVSIPVWHLLPEIRFVILPFRFLTLLSIALIFALFARGLGSKVRKFGIACLICGELVAFVSLVTPNFSLRHFHFRDHPPLRVLEEEWQHGYKGMREYVPAGVPKAQADPSRQRELAKQGAFATSGCNPTLLRAHPNERIVRTDSPAPCMLSLNTFYYPFWKAHLEDGASLEVSKSPAGLLQAAVPPGRHEIRFEFMPASRLRTGSAIVSLLILLVLLFGARMGERKAGVST